jgi:hypothetical protein
MYFNTLENKTYSTTKTAILAKRLFSLSIKTAHFASYNSYYRGHFWNFI